MDDPQGVFGLPGCPGESQQLCNIMRELLYLGAYNELVQSILVQAQVQFTLYKGQKSLQTKINYKNIFYSIGTILFTMISMLKNPNLLEKLIMKDQIKMQAMPKT